MSEVIGGRYMVKGGKLSITGIRNGEKRVVFPILKSEVPLSFWGGIDPLSGVIIDRAHPLVDARVTDTIFCLPSGRGSCTASQVLLELIRNRLAPRAIILRDADAMVSIGAIIAQEIFQSSDRSDRRDQIDSCDNQLGDIELDIIHVGHEGYQRLMESNEIVASVLPSGKLRLGQGDDSDDDHDLHHPYSPLNIDIDTDADRTALAKEERTMLESCSTEAERMALKVIFRYARLTSERYFLTHSKASAITTNEPHGVNNSDASQYIPIASSHIDGCTYIGPGGLEFVRRLVAHGGRVKVPTTLNSVSTDRRQWQTYGVPYDHATNSNALGDAYLDLGCTPSFTCAPYLLPNPPARGQQIAWGESNAVVYANSVLGARTEKYADYLDICCAIAGIVPASGMHLDQNRLPTLVLDATDMLEHINDQLTISLANIDIDKKTHPMGDIDTLFPILGYLCGSLSVGHVPLLIGLQSWRDLISNDNLKAFCAAFGTTGSSSLIHIAGITPEITDEALFESYRSTFTLPSVRLTLDQLESAFLTLDGSGAHVHGNHQQMTDPVQPIDLVALGNPHLSVTECRQLAQIIRDQTISTTTPRTTTTTENKSTIPLEFQKNDTTVPATMTTATSSTTATTRIMACMSRSVHEQVDENDRKTLLGFGMEFVFDTCWCMLLDEPIIPINPNGIIMTNSGKYAHYGPGLTKRQFRFGSMRDCIVAAHTGYHPQKYLSNTNDTSTTNKQLSSRPSWLGQRARTFATMARSRHSRPMLLYFSISFRTMCYSVQR